MQGYGGGMQHVLVGQQYVNTTGQPTVLVLKEKNVSMGTDSDVTNTQGQVCRLSMQDYAGHDLPKPNIASSLWPPIGSIVCL